MTRAKRQNLPRPSREHAPEARYTPESPVPRIDLPGVDMSRRTEGLGPRRHRDTTDLRALLAETVREYTTLLRRDQIARGVKPEHAVEIVDNYDPVVEMALLAVRAKDDIALAANAQVAKYVRPQLKSVEMISDQGTLEQAARKQAKAADLFQQLTDVARQRRLEHDKKIAERGVVLDTAEETLR